MLTRRRGLARHHRGRPPAHRPGRNASTRPSGGGRGERTDRPLL